MSSMGLKVWNAASKLRLDTDMRTMRVIHKAYLPAFTSPVGPNVTKFIAVPGLSAANGFAVLNPRSDFQGRIDTPPVYWVVDGGVNVQYAGSTFVNTHSRDYTVWCEYASYELVVVGY